MPARLGRLRRVERIGAGGFATVWRYHDDELDSDVAVKALAENWAQRLDVRERFADEARILRRAEADHVVKVYDNGETEAGIPYFVMSYADRGTVADLLERALRPSVEESLEIVRQAGEGLAVLHRNGILHRDVKPQNLLLRSLPDGSEEVLVADLGVAKAVAHASGLTQVVGTPSYIAPEQALGRPLDVRTDVHALGAVAYVLLTGRLVRENGLADLFEARLPPAPSTVAEVPPRLDAVVLKALALDPEDRWPDVASFLAALDGEEADPVTREAPGPASGEGRSTRSTAALALLVLAMTFVASYAVTALLR